MPLNIHVAADTARMWDVAWALRRVGRALEQARAQVDRASAFSSDGWNGGAADGFRSATARVSASVDFWSGNHVGMATELERAGERLQRVKQQMHHARAIADGAGLVTTDRTIADPGPGVPAPRRPPPGSAVTTADGQVYANDLAALDAHQHKVRAYHQAAKVVAAARADEKTALDYLSSFANDVAEGSPFTIADLVTGVAGASIEKTSKYRKIARHHASRAARWDRLARSPHLGTNNRVKATMAKIHHQVDEKTALRKTTGLLARTTDDLSPGTKTFLTRRLAGRLPIVGTAITVFQAGIEIRQGADPVQTGFSAGASLASGMAVGAAIGGPVGAVAGAVVSVGVGYVVDEWGDEFGQGVQDAAGAVGAGVSDTADAVGDYVGDLI